MARALDFDQSGLGAADSGALDRLADSAARLADALAGRLAAAFGVFKRQLTEAGKQAKSFDAVMRGFSKSFEKITASFSRLGEALKQAVTPVAAALAPAFDAVTSAVSGVLDGFAALMGLLFGTSGGYSAAAGAAGSYTKAAKAATSATKKAAGTLAAFDKLDVLAFGGSSGGGGGGPLPGVEEVPGLLGGIGELENRLRALADYFTTYFAPSITAWGEAFSALREPIGQTMEAIKTAAADLWQNGLRPLGEYLVYDFVPGVVNAFSETLAPIFRDVASFVILEFGRDFEFVAGLVTRGINDILIPGFELLKLVILGMLDGITIAWEEYGWRILEGMAGVKEGLRELIDNLYNHVIAPLFQSLFSILEGLWAAHLKPLWDNLLLFIGSVVDNILALWNSVLLPFLNWVAATFGPVFSALVGAVGQVFALSFGAMGGLVSGLLQALRGLMEFLTGIFTGNWARAWEGVKLIFEGVWNGIKDFAKGIINTIIGIINGMIVGVVAGVNAVIGAINTISIDIPDWVPVLGGSHLGFNLPTLNAPQIPMLAKGAVIPPNGAFLAVLGDQRSGTNLEAPEGLIRQILREELAGTGGGDVNIRFTGSLSQLARVLQPEIEREGKRQGVSLVQQAG